MSTIKKPYGRSLNDFLPLLPAEQVLCDSQHEGKPADIGSARPKEKTHANHVRAKFLRFLALGGDEDASTHERGIHLQGAWISNSLDLEGCNIPKGLILTKCYFEDRAVFRSAHFHGLLNLNGSQLPGLEGDRLVTDESFFMRDGFVATEAVRLIGAQIGGNLDCDGGEFDGQKGTALSAELANIQGCVFLRNGFKASGSVNLMRSLIGGSLECNGGVFDGKQSKALTAEGARIQSSVFLRNGFKSSGTVRLIGTQIGGSLDCDGGVFDGKQSNALTAEGARVQSSVYLRNGFKSSGTVCLIGVQIDGNLNCDGGEFDGQNGAALSAGLANIQGSVFFRNGFKASGTVNLMRSQIGGSLECNGGVLDGKQSKALTAEGTRIQSSVYLRNGFKSSGTVCLIGTQIGGSLDCSNGDLDGKGDYALLAERANVEGNVLLCKEFKANGTVNLISMKIGGDLLCQGGQFESTKKISINANNMNLRGRFRLQKLKKPVNGISLVATQVGQLADDEASWGTGLILDGFVYEHLSNNAPTNAQMRLEWLAKQYTDHYGQDAKAPWWKQLIRTLNNIRNEHQRQGFKPQPWKQLIRTLRNMGHDEDARRIAISYETHRRKIGVVEGKLRRTFHGLFGLLIGYGYRPLRLLYIMLGVWLFCGTMFWCAALHSVFAPSNPLIFNNPDYTSCRPIFDPTTGQVSDKENWYLCKKLANEYTGFSPLAYSLDLILPLVDLQQEHDWAPYIPTPETNWLDELGSFSIYHWTRLLVWLEILFGWLASLLMVAVISGLTNRNNEE